MGVANASYLLAPEPAQDWAGQRARGELQLRDAQRAAGGVKNQETEGNGQREIGEASQTSLAEPLMNSAA